MAAESVNVDGFVHNGNFLGKIRKESAVKCNGVMLVDHP